MFVDKMAGSYIRISTWSMPTLPAIRNIQGFSPALPTPEGRHFTVKAE